MFRVALLSLGMLTGVCFAQTSPTPSEKELQQAINIDEVKPSQGQQQEPAPSGWRAFGSTLLVVSIAGGALWVFKKYGAKKIPGSGGTRLAVEETLALGERRFVSILRADEETFLIGLSPQGITLLARMDALQPFDQALRQEVEVTHPIPVKEVEAMIKGARP